MPNKPRAGQTFIGFKCDEKLRGTIDRSRRGKQMSLWMREAVADKLSKELGIKIGSDLILPRSSAADHSTQSFVNNGRMDHATFNASLLNENASPVKDAEKTPRKIVRYAKKKGKT